MMFILTLCQVRAVVVENTFLSVSHMVDEILPVLTRIKPIVLRLKWNSEERARRLKRPILYISGKGWVLALLHISVALDDLLG